MRVNRNPLDVVKNAEQNKVVCYYCHDCRKALCAYPHCACPIELNHKSKCPQGLERLAKQGRHTKKGCYKGNGGDYE